MQFKIPLVPFADIEILKRKSKKFLRFSSSKKGKIDEYLKDSEEKINKRQYLAICYKAFAMNLLILSVVLTSILGLLSANQFYVYGLGSAILISGFILANQLNYPRMFSLNKAKSIEKNLISVLQDMMVQINSGIPMFQILLNIGGADYGEVTEEFKKITKEINAGISQIDAIEQHGKVTSSKYLKRVLWQISNGMRAGSDMSIVMKEEIRSLSEEQAIQIQQYGSKLNPLIMFYMLIAVILPSLGITFMIVVSSILNIPNNVMQLLFFGIFGAVLFIQIMFVGIIKSRRPSLL